MIASVVVDIPARAIDRPFDYRVPDELVSAVGVGVPVLVPFGGRQAVGYVVGLPETSGLAELRAIDAVLGEALFDAAHASVASWIADEYLCPLSEALRLMLPPGGAPRVKRCEEDGAVRWELQRPHVSAVDDRWAELTGAPPAVPLRASATTQRALLDALAAGPVRVSELAAELGSVDAALKRLEGLGAVRVDRQRRYRLPEIRERAAHRYDALSSGQRAAIDAIDRARAAGGGVVLVDGVTGSGKTEVYLRAIEAVVAEGGSAIVLVPEISLTPQTVGRFRSRFGDAVAVLHSRLSAGERYDQWDLAARGEGRVVVGARSALFAPVPDLRLVVIDEEHEASYKQGSAPRYHAREVAVELCGREGAVLVLGSATPSLDALERCERGEWTRVEMPDRVAGGALPEVHVVDMAAEFADGHRSMFSRPLAAALAEAMERGEKAVLFLNRRGFASFVLCRECGYVPRCESCAVSLTYHDVGHQLACHHCGARSSLPPRCPRCGSPYLRQFGAGTQRVEAELRTLLPDVDVVRMDADTTTGKGAHERLLAAFEALPAGILLGTQMVAKGLDYPEVTVVGVVNADTTLHLPDLRSGERTYQLLEQVAGRAGRGARPGHVFVQTYWPDHAAIRAAAAHDRSLFLAEEVEQRHALHYPPFGRLANLLVVGQNQRAVAAQAGVVADALRAAVDEQPWEVLGPAPAPLAKLKGMHRWHVLLKAPRDADIPALIRTALDGVSSAEGVRVIPDVDPLDLL